MPNLWIIALVILVIDQASKAWVLANFSLYQKMAILPHLNFSLGFNHGAAFGFLSNAAGWQRWIFMALAIIASCAILVWASRLKKSAKLERFGLACILGGALGNLLDRIIHGHVVDFIDVYVKEWHWYMFNVADIAIFIGATALFWVSFRR